MILVAGLLSCDKDDESAPPTDPGDLSEFSTHNTAGNEMLREVSQLLGKVMADTGVREEVLERIRVADPLGELVSLSFLLHREEGLSRRELEALKTGKLGYKTGQNRFREALRLEVGENSAAYPTLYGLIDRKGIERTTSRAGEDAGEALLEALAAVGLEIYHPFGEQVSPAKGDPLLTVTYRPMEYTESNEAFQFVSGSPTLVPFGPIDNDFIELNDVYIVGYLDDCDRPGADCDFVDLVPGDEGGDPTPVPGNPKLLTYNVNHAGIEEGDILSTRFAGFRVNGRDWLGFGATHQKLAVFRGSPDGRISIEDGRIAAASNSYRIGFFRIRAKGAKKGWWYHFNEEFDDDWNMSESEQAITVFTRHHLSGSATVELNTKAGLKLDGGKIKPVAEATVGSRVKVTLGSARQRTKSQLSRRQVLSSIVGPGVTGEVVGRDGTEWNVKKSGIFQYYFKHYFTDL